VGAGSSHCLAQLAVSFVVLVPEAPKGDFLEIPEHVWHIYARSFFGYELDSDVGIK
jgi:predicted RNA-binding protein with TRAM domain